ncbi:MAG TPA: DUF4199 family protein [Bacteroidota bacterium]|nr:DUF4199 family protein [Bacteroidota bacterium]
MKPAVKYGAWMGGVMCLYTTIMWLTKLDSTYLSTGQYLDIIVTMVPIIFIFLCIRSANAATPLNAVGRIKIGIILSLVSWSIYTPFLLLYHHVINPDWLTPVLDLKERELIAQGVSVEQITAQLDSIRSSGTDGSIVVMGLLVGVLAMGTILSLATLPFFRMKK